MTEEQRAITQNEQILSHPMKRKARVPRPTTLSKPEIEACNLTKFWGDPGYIFLPTQVPGLWTVISVEDIDLAQHTWTARRACQSEKKWYIQRESHDRLVHLHREVAGTPAGLETDHIDRNGLNNTRSNLRPATRRQNASNCANGRPGMRGVSWHRRQQKWQASIRVDGKLKFLGYYTDPQEAAHAYNRAALRYRRAFAQPNQQDAAQYQAIRPEAL